MFGPNHSWEREENHFAARTEKRRISGLGRGGQKRKKCNKLWVPPFSETKDRRGKEAGVKEAHERPPAGEGWVSGDLPSWGLSEETREEVLQTHFSDRNHLRRTKKPEKKGKDRGEED